MKFIFICFALIFFSDRAWAQKVNDALLLDLYQNKKNKEAADYLKSLYPDL